MAVTASWSDEGLLVSVDNDEAVITRKDYGTPPDPTDFTLVRPLVNFEVKVNNRSPAVPITFTACYTAADLNAVGNDANKLKLYYWSDNKNNPEQSRWRNIPITGDASIPSGYSGFVGAKRAMINASWPDPATAWGGG